MCVIVDPYYRPVPRSGNSLKAAVQSHPPPSLFFFFWVGLNPRAWLAWSFINKYRALDILLSHDPLVSNRQATSPSVAKRRQTSASPRTIIYLFSRIVQGREARQAERANVYMGYGYSLSVVNRQLRYRRSLVLYLTIQTNGAPIEKTQYPTLMNATRSNSFLAPGYFSSLDGMAIAASVMFSGRTKSS